MSKTCYWFLTQNFKEYDDEIGNNFEAHLEQISHESNIAYLAYAHGKGEHCETDHYHIILEFAPGNPRAFTTVKALFNPYHPDIEEARGNHDQSLEYLRKNATETSTEVVEFGSSREAGRGKRTDLDRLGQQLLDHEINLAYVARNYPGKFIQFGKRFRDLEATATQRSKTKPIIMDYELKCSFNSGISELLDAFETLYPDDVFFFDGCWDTYYGEHHIVLSDQSDFELLSKLRQGYPLRVGPNKRWVTSTHIHIVSSKAQVHLGLKK